MSVPKVVPNGNGAPLVESIVSDNEEPVWKGLLLRARKALAHAHEIQVNPQDIQRKADQPRIYFDEESLSRMEEALRAIGQIYPGIVRSRPAGFLPYELLDGERRWRGVKRIEGMQYRALLVEVDDEVAAYIIAAVANFNREGHTALEISDSIHRMKGLGIPLEEIAKLVGLSYFWCSKLIKLQKLSLRVRDLMDPNITPKKGLLPVSAAIEIAEAPESLQWRYAQDALSKRIAIPDLRQKLIAASHEVGVPMKVRTRQNQPNRQWESVRSLAGQTRRSSARIATLLGSEEVLTYASQRDRKFVLQDIEEAEEALRRCRKRLKDI